MDQEAGGLRLVPALEAGQTVATPWLDGKHTVFGKVIEGLEVVDSVAGGDAINSVKIEGDASALLAAKADRVTEWNRHLSA